VSDDLVKVLACRELASSFNKANPERNRFPKSNLGCGLAMSSALDWFFKQVDSGIVLEDDIDFSSSFLETMDYLLSTLKDNAQIGSITGLNPISTLLPIDFFDHENSYIGHNFFLLGMANWRIYLDDLGLYRPLASKGSSSGSCSSPCSTLNT
jgi:GR25 family glycosyltransferase involved in LPS biosynthesis